MTPSWGLLLGWWLSWILTPINKEIQSFVRHINAIALFIGVVFLHHCHGHGLYLDICCHLLHRLVIIIICSDKTRTLTQNQMTVANMWLNTEVITLETGKMNYAENFDPRTTGWEELGRIACLCSNSVIVDKEENWQSMTEMLMGMLLKLVCTQVL